jgi:hypothetical protein
VRSAGLGLATAGVLLALWSGRCGRSCATRASRAGASASSSASESPRLSVPRLSAAPKLDGEIEEPEWRGALRPGGFRAGSGATAHPFSEARFGWDQQNLYVALYAADQDIECRVKEHDGPVWIDDAFSLGFDPEGGDGTRYQIDLSATGVVTDVRLGLNGTRDAKWESGTRVGVDRDGSLNDASDEDEEWVIEAAIPLARLGIAPTAGTRFGLLAERCDTPKGAKRTCGSMRLELELRP